jgi:hypothetical protein
MKRILIALLTGIIMAASAVCQSQELPLSESFRLGVNVTGIQKIEKM